MEFLVEFEVTVPIGTAKSEIEQRREAEGSAAAKLIDQGHLERLWMMPETSSNDSILGLYCATTTTELNDLLSAPPALRVDGCRRDTTRASPQRPRQGQNESCKRAGREARVPHGERHRTGIPRHHDHPRTGRNHR